MQGQIAVLILEVTSCVTYKNVPNWHPDLVRVCKKMPIEFCGEQVNVTDQKIKGQAVNINRKNNLQVKVPNDIYIEIVRYFWSNFVKYNSYGQTLKDLNVFSILFYSWNSTISPPKITAVSSNCFYGLLVYSSMTRV